VLTVPDRPVVLDFDVSGTDARRFWLVLEHGTKPSICIEDPVMAGDRYLFVEADVRALYPIARQTRGWSAAIGDGSVQVFGAPELVEALPSWFASEHLRDADETEVRQFRASRRFSTGDGQAAVAAPRGDPIPRLASARRV
jgi:hypothetical protein